MNSICHQAYDTWGWQALRPYGPESLTESFDVTPRSGGRSSVRLAAEEASRERAVRTRWAFG